MKHAAHAVTMHAIGRTAYSFCYALPATDRCQASLLSPPLVKKTEPVGSAFSLCGAVTKHLSCEACCACRHNARDRANESFHSDLLSPPPIAVRRVLLSPPLVKKTERVGSAFSLCGAVTRRLTCEACCACCHNARDRANSLFFLLCSPRHRSL